MEESVPAASGGDKDLGIWSGWKNTRVVTMAFKSATLAGELEL